MEWLWSIDGNCVVHSWDSSAMNGSLAEVNNTFFFGQLSKSQIFEIWLKRRGKRKVHEITLVFFKFPVAFFITVENP
jgi:hypothetical protein